MNVALTIAADHPDLHIGFVQATGVRSGPASTALDAELEAALRARHADTPPEDAASDPVKAAIRDLLRHGGYKPTGRGKPASEYLAQAAARGEFPRISHMVDALNLTSLESGLPISLLDRDLALQGASGLVVRAGRAGERYVFNAAGQELELSGLLCVAREGGSAIGTPVKDSLAAKTSAATRDVVAIVWASQRAIDQRALALVCERLAQRLEAATTSTSIQRAAGR